MVHAHGNKYNSYVIEPFTNISLFFNLYCLQFNKVSREGRFGSRVQLIPISQPVRWPSRSVPRIILFHIQSIAKIGIHGSILCTYSASRRPRMAASMLVDGRVGDGPGHEVRKVFPNGGHRRSTPHVSVTIGCFPRSSFFSPAKKGERDRSSKQGQCIGASQHPCTWMLGKTKSLQMYQKCLLVLEDTWSSFF